MCLIPEIPYRFSRIVAALQDRRARKRRFSLVSVAEGAHPAAAHNGDAATNSAELAARLEEAVGMETRVTTLGYVQRGGVPTPYDRLLATQLGTAAAELISEGRFGVMVAMRGGVIEPVPLERALSKKVIPTDHPMIQTARRIGLCLGD